MENNELNHWGVRGMRWGVRRYQNKDGTLTAAGKKRYNAEMEKLKERERIVKNHQRTKAKMDKLEAKRKELDEAEELLGGPKKESKQKDPSEKTVKAPKHGKKKALKDMTDEELRTTISRLEMEKRYADLTTEKKKVSEGNKFVTETLRKSANNLAPQVLNYYGAKILNKWINERVEVTDKNTGKTVSKLQNVIFTNNSKK